MLIIPKMSSDTFVNFPLELSLQMSTNVNEEVTVDNRRDTIVNRISDEEKARFTSVTQQISFLFEYDADRSSSGFGIVNSDVANAIKGVSESILRLEFYDSEDAASQNLLFNIFIKPTVVNYLYLSDPAFATEAIGGIQLILNSGEENANLYYPRNLIHPLEVEKQTVSSAQINAVNGKYFLAYNNPSGHGLMEGDAIRVSNAKPDGLSWLNGEQRVKHLGLNYDQDNRDTCFNVDKLSQVILQDMLSVGSFQSMEFASLRDYIYMRPAFLNAKTGRIQRFFLGELWDLSGSLKSYSGKSKHYVKYELRKGSNRYTMLFDGVDTPLDFMRLEFFLM